VNDRAGGEAVSPQPRTGMLNAPPVVIATIAVLLIIHAFRWAGGEDWQAWTNYLFALLPARFIAGAVRMEPGSQWWSLLTYAFLHADWAHVGMNSLWLLIFGTPVARWFGTLAFLIIFAASAIGGGILMVIVHWGQSLLTVGASGAVSGLMAAAIPVMYGRGGRPLTPGELLRDRRALMFVVIWLGITLVTGAEGYINTSGIQIAWEAHLGGFVSGFIVYAIMMRRLVHG
jgi:membrane associated rhomboid family serine protease